MRIALVNPNTSTDTTAAMRRIALQWAAGAEVVGLTAPFGAALVTDAAALAEAAQAVEALAPTLAAFDAVVVSAFGDPGRDALRARLPVPVTGIAEAAMREAAAGGRTFAVATTTPNLREAIAVRAAREGHATFLGTWATSGDPVALMADRRRLTNALEAACRAAIAAGAEAVIIGGGPLADVAEILADRMPVPLIAPIPAALRLTLTRLEAGA